MTTPRAGGGDVMGLVDGIYAAAEDPAQWGSCLRDIAGRLGATGANLLHHDPRNGAGGVLVAAVTDPAALSAYGEHFHAIDPWAAGMRNLPVSAGRVLLGHDVVPRAIMVESEYYNDLGRHFGLTRAVFGLTGVDPSGTFSVVSFNRSDADDEFDADDAAGLGLLVPHLGRAMELQARLAEADVRASALDSLDKLSCAVFLVDGSARVRHANTTGETLLRAADGLTADDRLLRAVSPAATRQLRALCHAVAASGPPRHAGGALSLPRLRSSVPLQAVVIPVQRSRPLGLEDSGVVAVIFVTDPAAARPTVDSQLRLLYALTPAEARVAARMADGVAADTIAHECRYTIETTRWYWKRVLAKTGCRSQALLVRRVARAFAAWPGAVASLDAIR